MEDPGNELAYEHLLDLDHNLGNLLEKVNKHQITDGKL